MPYVPNLPDTFYRVSVKGLVFDDEARLLVFKDENGEWEVPGGGWEHAESIETCVSRELAEEAQASVVSVGKLEFSYRGTTVSGNPKLCLAVRVTLNDTRHFVPSSDNLVEARFVTKEELLALPFQKGEDGIQTCVDLIWPAAH
ncbi:MAG TPA: NUDIX hydrolase [Candidatus Saccharimonadales bacterium]